MNALIACLQFMTAIPLGKARPFDPRGIVACFPLAGLMIGFWLALFDWMATLLWPPLVAAVLDTVVLAAITGALHLDGLADTADGLYGGRERDRALAIMKDSRVGAMGLVAVGLLLLTKTAAIGHIDHGRFLALMIVPAYARSAMMFAMRYLPYVRGSEGTGSAFFATPLTAMDFRYFLLPLFLSLFLEWRGLLLNLVFLVGTAAIIGYYRWRLNGVTGDLLGAMTEMMEAGLFLVLCVGGVP